MMVCKDCGCTCTSCDEKGDLHLQLEIENLQQRLLEREHHIVRMESTFFAEAQKFPNGQLAALAEEVAGWQEKYSRLYEAHKKLQKVNQNLEDKLLKIVDKFETEKSSLTRDTAHLTQRLVEARVNINRLVEENERYKNDVSLAIQLLQCKPSNFVSQKIDSLPGDLQQKVKSYINCKRKENGSLPNKEMRTIKVPIPTFPPTAMVYSVNKVTEDKDSGAKPPDIVSAAIMAKVLEERERERLQERHCATCRCTGGPIKMVDQCIQTEAKRPLPSTRRTNNLLLDNAEGGSGWRGTPMVHHSSPRSRSASQSSNDSQVGFVPSRSITHWVAAGTQSPAETEI